MKDTIMDIRSLGSASVSGQLYTDRPNVAADANSVKSAQPAAILQPEIAVQRVGGTEKSTDTKQLTEAVNDINKVVQSFSQNVELSLDDTSSQVIVRVVDQQTKEVLRQIPSEEALELARSLDKIKGLLIHQQA